MATAELKADQLEFLASGGSLLLKIDASQPSKLPMSPGNVVVGGVQSVDRSAASPGVLLFGQTNASSVEMGAAGVPVHALGDIYTQNVQMGVGGRVDSMFVAGANIQQWMVLKIGSSGNVEPLTSGDAYEAGVVGVAAESVSSGQPIRVCINGEFKVVIDSGSTSLSPGQIVRRGLNDPGSVRATGTGAGYVGGFAVLIHGGNAGDAVSATYIRNELY